MAHEKICWRKTRNQEVIAELGRVPDAENPYENLLLGQHILADIIMSHLNKEGGEVLFDHRVVAIEKLGSEEGIKVEVEVGEHKEKRSFHSKYLVAADGGRSTVRKLCGIGFEGFTWPEQLVSTNVYYPFDEYGWHPGQFMCDPDHWALIGKINKEGLWRVSYGEIEGLSNDQIRDRLPMKFESIVSRTTAPQLQARPILAVQAQPAMCIDLSRWSCDAGRRCSTSVQPVRRTRLDRRYTRCRVSGRRPECTTQAKDLSR